MMALQWQPTQLPIHHMPMCIDLVRVHYQSEGGSLMMHTVDNTTATSATLTNLQCNTCYTIIVVLSAGGHRRESVERTVFVPQRGTL